MKFYDVVCVGGDQVCIFKNELSNFYHVAIEPIQNYSFCPSWVSRGYKSKQGAKTLYTKTFKNMQDNFAVSQASQVKL